MPCPPVTLPRAPPSEPLASEGGHFVGTRLELHDGDEPNCALRVEDRVDTFNHLEDLGEVAFDIRSGGVGLDDPEEPAANLPTLVGEVRRVSLPRVLTR
jgi:hypothetical protein